MLLFAAVEVKSLEALLSFFWGHFFERVTASISMALGSLVVLEEEEKDWKVCVGLLLHWVICSAQSH